MDRRREDTYCSVSVCTWLRFCSEILQDWSKDGGLGNSLMPMHWQNRSDQGNKALTYQCVHGMCSCASQLLNQAVTSSPGLLSTGGAVLSFQSLFSASSCSSLYRTSVSTCASCESTQYVTRTDRRWQPHRESVRYRAFWKGGREDQKWEQGRAGQNRHDSLKAA